ncbi:MAG: dTDP-4-dehydrorhamnose 3,5-epimerase [Alphaproteobacteria bacterium BRH_c36]|nr:MAG: dTDP-4-dehydrorhamnose 3,5-epimerase [Alphaproteobacteria bacterium BRH_c36]
MLVTPLGLPEVLEIAPAKFGDARGFFSETYNAKKFSDAGLSMAFVQDNHSFSAARGVLRGLHYQLPPFAQDKLVRVIKGAIFDVAVDIRRGSPRFGQWCARTISAKAWNQMFVPKGFAHGFLTLEPDTEVIYKVSDLYSPEHERAINFADPDIAIEWPLDGIEPTLSDKDRVAPFLKDQPELFQFSGEGISS